MADHVIIPESKIHLQEKSQWCYAAIAQLVVQHYQGRLISQTDIVKKVMAIANVVDKKNDNLPQDPYEYLNSMGHIRTSFDGTTPDPFVIRSEIDKGCPIIVRVGSPASGHYMLIVGYSDDPRASKRTADSSVSRVFYIDPLKKTYTIESGSDANSRVECEYEDSKKQTHRAKDNITGYHLTSPTTSVSSAASTVSSSKKTSPGKSKQSKKQGGRGRRSRTTKVRKSTCKCRRCRRCITNRRRR